MLRSLAEHATDGWLDLDRLDELSDEEVIAELVVVKRMGPWSADTFLISQLQRPDVLPVADLGIRRAVMRAYSGRFLPHRRGYLPNLRAHAPDSRRLPRARSPRAKFAPLAAARSADRSGDPMPDRLLIQLERLRDFGHGPELVVCRLPLRPVRDEDPGGAPPKGGAPRAPTSLPWPVDNHRAKLQRAVACTRGVAAKDAALPGGWPATQ